MNLFNKTLNELSQDNWSLLNSKFGDKDQLKVVGWFGRNAKGHKLYVLECDICSKDVELFNHGLFLSLKGGLIQGQIPCGCAFNPKWNKDQYIVLCQRQAAALGYSFIGFTGKWKGRSTKIRLLCKQHGEYNNGTIDKLLNTGRGCPSCAIEASIESRIKSDDVMITSFFDSGCFHPNTKFWRSARQTSQGSTSYWYMLCGDCGEKGEAHSGNLQKGSHPCACSKQRQTEGYIHFIYDCYSIIAIKFGISIKTYTRLKVQNKLSVYRIENHAIFVFPSVTLCKSAERECLQELECGILSKLEVPDGYSETTWAYNLEKVIEIYERNGGVRIE